ncbi:hypothetical protein B0H14DRAFT_3478623 [Mycena olivaceomarginata]|nr:hypothetical protein B0H14DRAFT_3478623 [Mycena olivaceomarginata]
MDSIYFSDTYGKPLVPVWSPFGTSFICSVGARTVPVAPRILTYREPVPFLLAPTTPGPVLADLDFTKFAVWYNSSEHWKAYIPNSAPRESPFGELEEDPVGICYGEFCVGTTEETREVYTNNDDVDQPEFFSEGSFLSVDWVEEILLLGRRLHSICQALVTSSDFYRKGGTVGEYPDPLDQDRLRGVHEHSQAAQLVAQAATRGVLSMLGFVAWFLTVMELHHTRLSDEVKDFITSLRLNEHPKVGLVYDLDRDVHELNFEHLINNNVPFHYVWSNKERGDPCFICFSPEYYHEVANLLTAAKGGEVRVQDLPSFHLWKDDLAGTDWMGRNLRAGKRGVADLAFKPDWEYEIVDDHGFGARPLYHWHMIRAYAERFKAATRTGSLTTTCTFFRHNPIGIDEPPFARPLPVHRFALSDFARLTDGEAKAEMDYYYESTVRVREQVKTVYAPRPGRRFSSFDGRLTDEGIGLQKGNLLPTPISRARGPSSSSPAEGNYLVREDRASRSPWVRQMEAAGAHPGPATGTVTAGHQSRSRSVSDASLNSNSSRASVTEEFYSTANSSRNGGDVAEVPTVHGIPIVAVREGRETPFSAPPSPSAAWTLDFQSLDHALNAISKLAPSILDVKPRQAPYGDLNWDYTWLNHAYLVCLDPRTATRLKTLTATLFPELEHVEDVLEYALRFGMPFEIYTDRVNHFRDVRLTDLERNTLPSIYSYGYGDQLMQWSGGGEEQYRVYQGSLHILGRPNAVAFLAMGGICKFVAEVYAPDLVHCFACGPSPQVAEFVAGKQRWISVEGEAIAHSTDQVSPREVNILLGQISGKQEADTVSLWPPLALLEKHCPHMRGYLSVGAYDFLESLRRKIVNERKYEWKTNTEWKRVLRNSAKGVFTLSVVPSPAHFDEMNEVLSRSFPVDWTEVSLGKLGLPEEFEPRSYRS